MSETPQYIIEGIILRRLHEKRIEGYTIEMAKEIAEALGCPSQPETVTVECTHPNQKVWMHRDDDVFMLCPDCGSRWVRE